MKKLFFLSLAVMLLLTGCGGGKEVYGGEGYEFSYSADKWEFYYKYDSGAVQFAHKENESTYFFVEVIPITGYDDASDIDINEELKIKKEIYEDLGSTDFKADIINRGGQDWIRLEDSSGLTQYSGNKGKNSYCITFMPYGNYDKSLKDFEEIFNSFEFTE
ncbi:MAG: hypothetical protein HDT25_00780 [Ruminococcus sp.]|nr:hypothetical protein [Ruminococcus sp.]